MKATRKRTTKEFKIADHIYSHNNLGITLSGSGDFESIFIDINELYLLKERIDKYFSSEYGKQYVRDLILKTI